MKHKLLYIFLIVFILVIHISPCVCTRLFGCTDSGLRVFPKESKLFDISNMNPGQKVSSSKTILNSGNNPFELILKAQRENAIPSFKEKELLKKLNLSLNIDGHSIFNGSMIDFLNDDEGFSLGLFKSGDIKEIVATAYLPGPETGNDFQGLSVDTKWIFVAKNIRMPNSCCCNHMPLCLLTFHLIIFGIIIAIIRFSFIPER